MESILRQISTARDKSRVALLVPAFKAAQTEALYEPGPFPVAALSGWQARVCEALARHHKVQRDLVGMAALAVTAATLGKAWVLEGVLPLVKNFANIFVFSGCNSGGGKAAAAQLATPLLNASDKLVEEWTTNQKPRLLLRRRLAGARVRQLTRLISNHRVPAEERAKLEGEALQAVQEQECANHLLVLNCID